MRIGENLPSYYFQYSAPSQNPVQNEARPPVAAERNFSSSGIYAPDQERANYLSLPGVMVDLSPQAKAFMASPEYANNKEKGEGGSVPSAPVSSAGKATETAPTECQTCKNRRYVDGSDDPSVSFQSPTHISPGAAGSAVRSHEYEHVAHEQAKADREGRRVVSQTVTIQTSICPECGRVYVSGGVTRTITSSDNKSSNFTAPPEEQQS